MKQQAPKLAFLACVTSKFQLVISSICCDGTVQPPGGVFEVYMTGGGGGGGGGGSDGASYCKPKKIHKPEILDPKKYLATILKVFPEHTSLKKKFK